MKYNKFGLFLIIAFSQQIYPQEYFEVLNQSPIKYFLIAVGVIGGWEIIKKINIYSQPVIAGNKDSINLSSIEKTQLNSWLQDMLKNDPEIKTIIATEVKLQIDLATKNLEDSYKKYAEEKFKQALGNDWISAGQKLVRHQKSIEKLECTFNDQYKLMNSIFGNLVVNTIQESLKVYTPNSVLDTGSYSALRQCLTPNT
ncbi:MAG: hypothetical protein M1114_00295 [Candidatus Dependentiae bacterium]|nr:hypothetical protein [Candidatus Dependentiae bacterium]